ncbi:MAG: bacteriohemerythrin [Candidatus Magnetoovum sp. WYHC-5]|nr:bacteriohemerythrin [Candidatus Magnetoovum sp. WYHC-5]
MDIKWDESLRTGVAKIDEQHMGIIERINALINLPENEKETEVDKVLRFLGGYVIEHFQTEENIMIKYKYPDYDSHKAEHMSFLKNYSQLKRLFEKEGATELIIQATQNQAVDWIINHIKKIDKKMAAFLKDKIA